MNPIRLTGTRGSSYSYYYNGYVYHADSRSPCILRCKYRGKRRRCASNCYAVIYLDENSAFESDNNIRHTCKDANFNYVEQFNLKKACVEKAGSSLKGLRKIYNDLTAKPTAT